MSADFFYNIYRKFSKRSSKLRLRITPFGIIVFSVCLISGLAGINIFDSGLYRIFTLTLSMIIISRFSRIKDFSGLTASVFFDRQYRVDEPSKYAVTLINESERDIYDMELVPEAGDCIPSKEDFKVKKEPGEENRNFWDRNIYYFRWTWHIIRLHKADFTSIKNVGVKKKSFVILEADIIPLKRGIINLKGLYVTKKDIFGLYTSSIFLPAENRIVILPKLTNADVKLKNRISVLTDRKSRSLSFYLMKHKTGDFIGIREYSPGDPMKNIHWKTWAKKDRPAVVEKGFEKIKECSVIMANCIDSENKDTELFFENSLSYIYSALKFLENDDFEVTFFCLTEKGEITKFTAEKEKGNFPKLYNMLAELEYYIFPVSRFISKLKKDHNPYGSTMLFCINSEPEVIKFANERNIPVFSASHAGSDSRSLAVVPRINRIISEVNIP